jgi:hypothetical protein
VDIDASIDALTDALAGAGVEVPHPPADTPNLDAIDETISPMSLPGQVRRFWQRVDPRSLRVWTYPQPIDPGSALDAWKQERDEFPGMAPRTLFLVGYESWACMSVELDSPDSSGGSLFEWRLEDGGFYLRHHELSDWLDRMTELILAGEFERRDVPAGQVLHLTDPHTSLPLTGRPAPPPPNPVHGDVTEYEREPLRWPALWQRLSGIEPEDVLPRGATHTIYELLSSDPALALEATIAARVDDLGGFGDVTRVRVSDGTGTISINCPRAVTMLGPGMRQEYEFDVVVPPGERQRPPDLDAIEPADDPVEDISQRLMARYGGPATAVARAIRPL